MMDKYVGKRLDDRYDIQELIGIGGMAMVYKAYDRVEERTVAIKILKEEYRNHREFMRRFRNESRAIAMLSHPNIVRVFDVSFGDQIQYIVMEYIDGITLKEYISQQKRIRWKEAVYFTQQILYALQHAHEKGIIHRDIKPQNILLLKDGTIKVTDFGIARFSNDDGRTLTDKAIGSVHYIAPEQARGAVTDEKTDVYSVGIMLYEMLTGQLPFDGENAVSVAIMQMQSEAKRPTELNPDIPEGLEEITIKAMQKDPQLRYASAAEMIQAINQFRQNPSISFQYKYFIDEKPTKYVEAIDKIRSDHRNGSKDGTINMDHQRRKISLIAILSGMLAAIVLFAILVGVVKLIQSIPNEEEAKSVFLPDFTGMTEEEIKEQYEDVFTLVFEPQSSETVEQGKAISQEPKGGIKEVIQGSTVTVYISSGADYLVIPDGLVNLPASEAVSILKENGFTSKIESVYDSSIANGYVVAVSPPSGSSVVASTEVIVYVSIGEEETEIMVPDLLQLTEDEAKMRLLERGLKIAASQEEYSDTIPEGQVIRSDPEYGTILKKGDAVTLTISKGPEPIREHTVSFNVTLPTTANTVLEMTVWMNGVQVDSRRVDPSLTTSTQVSLSGEANGVSVVIRMNGKDYQQWVVDFADEKAYIVRDYGYTQPVSSVPEPESPSESSIPEEG